jgi:transcriptional regulator with XRE-family HTH domain
MKIFIGKNLTYLRHFFDLTVYQIADVMVIGVSHYRKLECNQNGITVNKLILISKFYEINMEDLLNTEANIIAKILQQKDTKYVNKIINKLNVANYLPINKN